MLLAVPPVRWLLKKVICAPGDGPSEEASKKHRAEYRAVATADVVTEGKKPRAYCRAYWEGGVYHRKLILFLFSPRDWFQENR